MNRSQESAVTHERNPGTRGSNLELWASSAIQVSQFASQQQRESEPHTKPPQFTSAEQLRVAVSRWRRRFGRHSDSEAAQLASSLLLYLLPGERQAASSSSSTTRETNYRPVVVAAAAVL